MLHNPANKLHEQQNIASNELKIKNDSIKGNIDQPLRFFSSLWTLNLHLLLTQTKLQPKKKNLDHFLQSKVNLKIKQGTIFCLVLLLNALTDASFLCLFMLLLMMLCLE